MQHQIYPLEVKFAGDADERAFTGYGAVFGNVDHHGDVIEKGAFRTSIKRASQTGQWPSMLLEHGGFFGDESLPIGIWTELEEDDKGLKVAGKLAKTARAEEVYSLLKMTPRPAITGLSIGFIPKEWKMREKPEDPRRIIKSVDLVEISLVTRPANPLARVGNVKSIRDAERALRDVGFSQREAKAILANGYDSLKSQRDVADEGLADVAALLTRRISKLTRGNV